MLGVAHLRLPRGGGHLFFGARHFGITGLLVVLLVVLLVIALTNRRR